MYKLFITLSLFLVIEVFSYDIIIDTSYVNNISNKNKSLNRSYRKEVVYDLNTNLIWQDSRKDRYLEISYNEANRYCKTLSLSGYDNWRIPTLLELFSILDSKYSKPAINKVFKIFVYNFNSSYWTSTKNKQNERLSIGFEYGEIISDGYSKKNIRCVHNSKK